MLDFDLAEMYGTETGQLKRAVRRNIERFEGDDFMFELTKEELSRCQIGILNKGRGSNFKYMPFAFTELCKPLHNFRYAKNIIMQSKSEQHLYINGLYSYYSILLCIINLTTQID